jgi:hypothetical protein
MQDLSPEELAQIQLERMHNVQSGFTGTTAQLGPDIQDAMIALGFESVPTPKGQIPKCRSLFMELGKDCFPYEYQVNALAHILANWFGSIPTKGLPEDHLAKPEVQKAFERLARCRLGASGLCDQAGNGKTIPYLMAAQWVAEFGPDDLDADGNTIYRPALITVPKSIVLQLCNIIIKHFPKLSLVLSYSEHQQELGKYMIRESQIKVRESPRNVSQVSHISDNILET